MTATDSMGYRIEALRVYLEMKLGDVPFVAAYKHLIVSKHRVLDVLSRICKEMTSKQMMNFREFWAISLSS